MENQKIIKKSFEKIGNPFFRGLITCLILFSIANLACAQYESIRLSENSTLDFGLPGGSSTTSTTNYGYTSGYSNPYVPTLLAQSTGGVQKEYIDPATSSAATTPGSSFINDPFGISSAISSGKFPWLNSEPAPAQDPNPYLPESMQHMRRLIEKFQLEYTFIPRDKNKSNGFSIHEVSYQTQFYIPCRYTPGQAPLYISPGANLYWWSGPYNHRYHMPGSAFSAFVDFDMEPRFNEHFGLDCWFRIGAHSDFKKVRSECLRYQGRLAAEITVVPGVTRAVLGATYLDREHIKLLPVIGIIWTPNAATEWRLVFPNPKLATKIQGLSTKSDWWVYITGEYGGDSWSITSGSEKILTDYNDIRIGVGLEGYNVFNGAGTLKFEFGGVFARELYANKQEWCKPGNEIYITAKIAF